MKLKFIAIAQGVDTLPAPIKKYLYLDRKQRRAKKRKPRPYAQAAT